MTTKEERMAEFTRREIEDDNAFHRLIVEGMVFLSTTDEHAQTLVIGNARRAWHKALEWERKRVKAG
jgi:hypothetical protein